MPTASPIISARTGVFALSSRNPDAVVMPAMPMPMPTSAVSSGSPAASSDPNVITRTSAATSTPRISVAPVSGAARVASPPISAVSAVPSVARWSAARSASVSSTACWS